MTITLRTMDTADLRRRLGDILNEEEREEVNWSTVQRLCRDLGRDVGTQAGLECPHFVHHYLADADIRAKDDAYGDEQRAEVRRFVETGEYEDSTPASPWGCLGALAVVAALQFALLR